MDESAAGTFKAYASPRTIIFTLELIGPTINGENAQKALIIPIQNPV